MSELKPCPFCGGEAVLVEGEYGMYLTGYAIYCKGTCGAKLGVTGRLCEAYEWTPYFETEAEAIAAWNSRAAKPCYAADANYERCKYGVNRGWCDDAPFLVWDDTGHLFITMGGLKTWDVTDDARKWSAAHGTLTAEQVREAIKANAYPETSTTFEFGSSSWQEIADELNSRAERTCEQEERGWGTEGDHARVWLTCGHDCMVPTVQDLPNYCPNCGARVVE